MSAFDRTHPFWQERFADAFREALRREPLASELMQGPIIAQRCAALADECLRELRSVPSACEHCNGVGCATCSYSGKSNAIRHAQTIDASDVGELPREFLAVPPLPPK
jgi:hypothetical protein